MNDPQPLLAFAEKRALMIHVRSNCQTPPGLVSPDVFFTPGYGRAITLSEGGEWFLFEGFDGGWQLPLIVRTLIDGGKDAITPHFSGVYASPSLSPVQIKQAWSETVSGLRELGVISVVLRQSPHVAQAPEVDGQKQVGGIHPTIVLEPADIDSAWTDLVSTCRTRIRKATKNGYTGRVRPATSEDLAQGSDFRRLYQQTMGRLNAAPVFSFSDEYYQELHAGLGANLLIAEVRDTAGTPVSSALLMRHGNLLHYHLTGSNLDDARMGTNNLMIWAAIQYSAQHRLQFHLGGGRAQRDELFRFKRTFGRREGEYRVSGLIIDDERYRHLVEMRAKECDTTSEALVASEFFPAYRGGFPHA